MYVGNVIIFQGNIATVLFNFQRHTKKVLSCLYSLEAEVTITEGVNYEVLQRDHHFEPSEKNVDILYINIIVVRRYKQIQAAGHAYTCNGY